MSVGVLLAERATPRCWISPTGALGGKKRTPLRAGPRLSANGIGRPLIKISQEATERPPFGPFRQEPNLDGENQKENHWEFLVDI